MIQANELRRGNLFYPIDRSNEVHLPIEIPFAIAELHTFEVMAHHSRHHITSVEKYSEFLYRDLEPIPLTEEWLLRAGAEAYKFDHKPSEYRIGNRLIVVRDGCFYEYGNNLKLEFVHRFQNLFFELQNGKELEFKL